MIRLAGWALNGRLALEHLSLQMRPKVVASAGKAMTAVVATQVSVRELKTHLCEWLSRAQAGEVVGVTSHRLRIGIELMILRPQR
jgi:hypothetical protein